MDTSQVRIVVHVAHGALGVPRSSSRTGASGARGTPRVRLSQC